MQVDHAFAQPLQYLAGGLGCRPVIPVFINAAAQPRPGMARTRAFGAALGRFAIGLDKRVLIIGSGGLSHDPPVPSLTSAPPDVVQNVLIGGRNPTPEARQARQSRTTQAALDFAAGRLSLRALNDDWDRRVLQQLKSCDLEPFDAWQDADISAEGGAAGHEIRTWLAALSAQSQAGPYQMEVLFQRAIPEWIVGMAMAYAEPAQCV